MYRDLGGKLSRLSSEDVRKRVSHAMGSTTTLWSEKLKQAQLTSVAYVESAHGSAERKLALDKFNMSMIEAALEATSIAELKSLYAVQPYINAATNNILEKLDACIRRQIALVTTVAEAEALFLQSLRWSEAQKVIVQKWASLCKSRSDFANAYAKTKDSGLECIVYTQWHATSLRLITKVKSVKQAEAALEFLPVGSCLVSMAEHALAEAHKTLVAQAMRSTDVHEAKKTKAARSIPNGVCMPSEETQMAAH